jgi:hypothetical protein
MRCSDTDLHAVLACRCYNLTAVELDCGDGMIILERFEDAASPDIPNLRTSQENMMWLVDDAKVNQGQ